MRLSGGRDKSAKDRALTLKHKSRQRNTCVSTFASSSSSGEKKVFITDISGIKLHRLFEDGLNIFLSSNEMHLPWKWSNRTTLVKAWEMASRAMLTGV